MNKPFISHSLLIDPAVSNQLQSNLCIWCMSHWNELVHVDRKWVSHSAAVLIHRHKPTTVLRAHSHRNAFRGPRAPTLYSTSIATIKTLYVDDRTYKHIHQPILS